jgi:hypothetical protein
MAISLVRVQVVTQSGYMPIRFASPGWNNYAGIKLYLKDLLRGFSF